VKLYNRYRGYIIALHKGPHDENRTLFYTLYAFHKHAYTNVIDMPFSMLGAWRLEAAWNSSMLIFNK
jgi:hypothetical protein